MRSPVVVWFGSFVLFSALIAPGDASAGWVVGSDLVISVQDSPLGTSFTQTVTLGAPSTVLDQGELTLTQTLVPAGPGSEWLVLNYQATGSYLIGGDPGINWEYEATGQTTSPTNLTLQFFNWTVNGSFINTINSSVWGQPIVADPLNPSLGNVFLITGAGVDPSTAQTSWPVFAQIDPYSLNDSGGDDTSTANGFVFAAMVTDATVPEPSSFMLASIASVAIAIGMSRRRRRNAVGA
jgi:PEP-CTERM motif